MDDAALQNANPTILTSLPTRRPSTLPSSIGPFPFQTAIPPPFWLKDPFCRASSPSSSSSSSSPSSPHPHADEEPDPIDAQEIYDLISTISDPEHPLSLGSLSVVNLQDIHIAPLSPSSNSNPNSKSKLQIVTVEITPTISHCSLATLIGLGIRVRLERSLPPRFRVDVRVKEGTHSDGEQVNKQLGDKERVAAALENRQLAGVLGRMMETCV